MADRFLVIHKESTLNTSTQVIVDTATAVCYLWHRDGYGGGLTPLLGKDGKPVITDLPK